MDNKIEVAQEKYENLLIERDRLRSVIDNHNKELEKIPEEGDVYGNDDCVIERLYVYKVSKQLNIVDALHFVKHPVSGSVYIMDTHIDYSTLKNFKYISKSKSSIRDMFLIGE